MVILVEDDGERAVSATHPGPGRRFRPAPPVASNIGGKEWETGRNVRLGNTYNPSSERLQTAKSTADDQTSTVSTDARAGAASSQSQSNSANPANQDSEIPEQDDDDAQRRRRPNSRGLPVSTGVSNSNRSSAYYGGHVVSQMDRTGPLTNTASKQGGRASRLSTPMHSAASEFSFDLRS